MRADRPKGPWPMRRWCKRVAVREGETMVTNGPLPRSRSLWRAPFSWSARASCGGQRSEKRARNRMRARCGGVAGLENVECRHKEGMLVELRRSRCPVGVAAGDAETGHLQARLELRIESILAEVWLHDTRPAVHG